MKICNITKGTAIAQSASIAETFLARLIGLIGKDVLQTGEALVIRRCNSIHMFFMRFAIDAIFVDDKNRVTGLAALLKPWHLSPVFWKSSFVIELPAGTIGTSRTSVGDIIELREKD